MKNATKSKASARRRSGRPPKKSLLQKTSAHTLSEPPTPPKQSTLPESELDIWFQSGPFSKLPQGATPAEILGDLKLVRATIDDLANIFLASVTKPSSIPSTSPGSSTLSRSFPKNKRVSVELPSLSLSASASSSRRSSRVKVQTAIVAGPIGFVEPLTPESFYGEDTSLKDTLNDGERFMDALVPFSCSQLDATEAERLTRLKKRGAGGVSNRIEKLPRPKTAR